MSFMLGHLLKGSWSFIWEASRFPGAGEIQALAIKILQRATRKWLELAPHCFTIASAIHSRTYISSTVTGTLASLAAVCSSRCSAQP